MSRSRSYFGSALILTVWIIGAFGHGILATDLRSTHVQARGIAGVSPVLNPVSTLGSAIVPVEVPGHKNTYCPCFSRLDLAIRLTTSNDLGTDEMQVFIAGAQAAAKNYNITLQIAQGAIKGATQQTQSEDFVGATTDGFRGTIISNIPSAKSPANGALQVVMNSYPNVSVIGVMSGQERTTTYGKLLGYVGPNATDSGYQGVRTLQSIGGLSSNAFGLCLNPLSGTDEGTDNACAGARYALKELQPGIGGLEEFVDFDNTRVDTARQALIDRLKQSPVPNVFISPTSFMTTVLFGVGSTDLVAAIRSKNVSVIVIGPTPDALAAVKQGLVQVIVDHREYFQGYFSVVQAQLFQMASATLGNKFLWTGPAIYTTANLTAQNLMPDFEKYVNLRAARFPQTGEKSIFTLVTHANRPSSFWAGWRSGLYQAAQDINVTLIEMLTEVTDGDVQASFVNNVTIDSNPVKTDGWLATFSRRQPYGPLSNAYSKGIPIVGMNARGPDATVLNNYGLLAYVGMSDDQASFEMVRRMEEVNPLATQTVCIQSVAAIPANITGRCLPVQQRTRLNFTFVPVIITNVDRAVATVVDVVTSFPKNTRMHIIDGGSACIALQAFQAANLATGPGTQISLGVYDLMQCKFEAALKGLINYVVIQQEYVQGYLPVALQKIYKQTGGAPFGNRLLVDKTLGVPYPWILTGNLLTPDLLSGSFFNCTAATANSTVISGPTDITAFPFGESAFPVCALQVVQAGGLTVFTTTWDSGSAVGVLVLAILVAVPIIAGMVILTVKKAHKTIKAMSPTFVICMLVGMLGLDLMALGEIGAPSAWKCAMETFLIPTFFALIVGCLILKNWRIYRIFNNANRVKKPISDLGLLMGVALVLTPELILAIAWVAAAPKYPQLRAVNSQVAAYVCASDQPQVDSIILGLFYAYNALLLLICAALAFLTRNVSDAYSETSMIGYSVYNACGTIVVLVPLLMAGVINDPTVNFWFKVILLIYPTMFGFAILFGERLFYRVWKAESAESSSESDSLKSGKAFDVSTRASPSKVKASGKNHFVGTTFGIHSCPVVVLHKKKLIAQWEAKTGVLYDRNLIILFESSDKELPRVGSVINMLFWKVGREVHDKENKIYSIEFYEAATANTISNQASSMINATDKDREKRCTLVIDFTNEEHYSRWISVLRPGVLGGGQTGTQPGIPG
ncbi:7 transmembrane sweet-taste receptor of 3 GCPR-domain-containing protein [Cladochytrium replicatum]|nr:7 transmembrane sweet-taste receptor of 3 GCPR-domain-containing protein [Cladochytrium replicatum]